MRHQLVVLHRPVPGRRARLALLVHERTRRARVSVQDGFRLLCGGYGTCFPHRHRGRSGGRGWADPGPTRSQRCSLLSGRLGSRAHGRQVLFQPIALPSKPLAKPGVKAPTGIRSVLFVLIQIFSSVLVVLLQRSGKVCFAVGRRQEEQVGGVGRVQRCFN